jgi:hypothetical protein
MGAWLQRYKGGAASKALKAAIALAQIVKRGSLGVGHPATAGMPFG